jgi:hypothetical protein
MFSREEIKAEIRKTYAGDICWDFLDDAATAESLAEAATIIILDSNYWNDEI